MKSKAEFTLSSPGLVPASVALKHGAVSAGPGADAKRGCAEIQPSLWSTAGHKRTALSRKHVKYVQMHFIKDNVFTFWAALF